MEHLYQQISNKKGKEFVPTKNERMGDDIDKSKISLQNLLLLVLPLLSTCGIPIKNKRKIKLANEGQAIIPCYET